MWSNMMATQKIFEDRVDQLHGVDREELFEERILALTDEVMEYAKSTKCFKYWSLSDPDPDHVRLEEFVDGIHFYLSFSNTFELDPDWLKVYENNSPSIKSPDKKENITYHITRALKYISNMTDPLNTDLERADLLLQSFSHFWAAGQVDGFTRKDVETAYYLKNKKNHERQSSGY